MAKLVSTLFMSLDGIAEIDETWHFPYFDENMARAVSHDYDGVETLLLGRLTYDSFAGAWPEREEAGEEDAEFAKFLGDLRKLVVSRQPLEFTWRNSELLDGELVEAVTELKANPSLERILIAGSISIVQQLLAAGLIDELSLLVHPVAARKGRHLFDAIDEAQHLSLVRSEAFPTGVLWLRYAPAAAPDAVGYEEIKDLVPDTERTTTDT
jgi:dihydrofolate reductase